MNKIYRSAELNTTSDSRIISGYSVVFDSWSRDLGGFKEIIRKGAITQELVDNSDVIFNYNHDDNQMLARWNKGQGTLKLELREEGLYFEFEAPDTNLGNEVLWHIRNGNLFDCSFAFTLPSEGTCQRWYKDEEGTLCREIFTIDGLFDSTVCSLGAYSATSVSARSQEAIDALAEIEKAEKELRKQEIIDKLDNKLKSFLENMNVE